MKRAMILAATAAMLVAPAAHAQKVKTVFYIAMENHNFTQPSAADPFINPIKGNVAAPFINSLITAGNPNAAMVSYASNYQNVPPTAGVPVHPSEPNYVWMEAGTDPNNLRNDANPYPNNIVNSPNLSAVLTAHGKTWTSYQEDTDLLNTDGTNHNGSAGTLTNNVASTGQYEVPLASFSGTSADYTNEYNGSHQYNYAAKHNPQVFFTDTNGGNDPTSANPESQFYAPLQRLGADLANNSVSDYNWISPDQYNDMHTALNGGFTYNGVTYTGDEAEIAQGDNFLSQIIPMIEASQAFKDNGEIVIWNDETEGDGSIPGQFSSMEIVISPLAKGNAYTNNILYDHSNDLATLQQILGVDGTPLGAAAGAYTMADLYKAGAVPEPATWAIMLTGFGLLGGAMRRGRGRAAATA